MPMSRLPRSDWLGSSTSPPLITRSNLSSGVMAARAEPPRASANEPAVTRKSRRDALGMAFLRCGVGEFVVIDPRFRGMTAVMLLIQLGLVTSGPALSLPARPAY